MCVRVFVFIRTCVAVVAYLCETDVRGGESCALWRDEEEGFGRQQPFGGRCARLIPARLNPHLPLSPSCFYTPIGRAHAHTGRGHTTTGKKLEIIIKLHVVFHPPSCLCVCSSCIRFSYFFSFLLLRPHSSIRVINKYSRRYIYHITELTIIIKIGISLVYIYTRTYLHESSVWGFKYTYLWL